MSHALFPEHCTSQINYVYGDIIINFFLQFSKILFISDSRKFTNIILYMESKLIFLI